MKKYVVEFRNQYLDRNPWSTHIIQDTLEEAEAILKKAKSTFPNLIWRINHKDPSVKSTDSDIPPSYNRSRRPQPVFGVASSGECITSDGYHFHPPINITNWSFPVSFQSSVSSAALIPQEVE